MASSFEAVFKAALEDNLSRHGATASVAQRKDFDARHGPVDSVIMNIASVRFKVVVVISFPRDQATRDLFAHALPEDGQDGGLVDAYCDFGNMALGQVNRCLSRTYRFSGISTPIVMEEDSMTGWLFDNPATERLFLLARAPSGAEVGLSVIVHSGAQELAFKHDIKEPGEGFESFESFEDDGAVASGELELF